MIDPEVIVEIKNNCIKRLEHRFGAGKLLKLLNGHKATESFYGAVLAEVQFVIDGMEHSIYYTARDLCGEDFWLSLRPWNRKVAGMCVADAVKRGRLPFIFRPQSYKDRSTRKYMISPTNHNQTNKET
jgi:hypothetical protein